MKRLLLSSVLSIFCLTLSAQTNTWNGSNGFWDTPGSWSLNIVPNQEHDVVIPAGSTVLLNVDAFTKSITLQGNAIFNIINTSSLDLSFTNASTFSAASSFNWSGGTIKGGGTLTLNGTTVITPENTYYFKRIEDNTTIINNGTLLQQGSADILIHHGTLINNPSGVIEMQVAGANIVKASNAIEATVINEGLIKRTGTGRVDIKKLISKIMAEPSQWKGEHYVLSIHPIILLMAFTMLPQEV